MSSSVSNPTPAKKSAMSFVSVVIGRPVNIKLNSGVVYRGILACIDGTSGYSSFCSPLPHSGYYHLF